MSYQLLKCVSHIEDFNPDMYKKMKIGVEIQDFSKSNAYEGNWQELIQNYQRLLIDFPYPKTLHGPFIDLKPISPDHLIQKVSREKYLQTIKIAKALDVDTLLFHSQINPWINLHEKSYFHQAYREFFEELFESVGGYDKTIVLENIFEDDPQQLLSLIEGINLPNIKVCLDIGHSRIKNQTVLEDWFKVLGKHIHYVHVHWNDRRDDQHKPIPPYALNSLIDYIDRYTDQPMIAIEYEPKDLLLEIIKYHNYL